MPDAVEMPRYQSHKIVSAFEIKTIAPADGEIRDSYKIWPVEEGYGPLYLPVDTFARWLPSPGDFVVQYDDDYWSASPRKAFLEGYKRIVADNRNAVSTAETQTNVTKARADTSPQELRRWAIVQAISANYSDEGIITMAATIERYVLDGEPAKIGGDAGQPKSDQSGMQTLGQPGVQAGSTLGAAQQRAGEVWR